ncbi:hypothetical protein GYMLUDRAFT_108984, partial [Collybiopsis luxurians FD-317 M1]
SRKPIVLLFDEHGSHISKRWINLALANNILLFCLPPHTTHCLQPLDVSCFGPLQTAWFNQCCDTVLTETGEPMELQYVVKEYWEARKVSFKESTILASWQKSGIQPLNPSVFSASDFAPSIPLSIRNQLPESFP